MDPVAGIGLAASIVTIVQFGINAARTCQQIYQQGSTMEHADADNIASHLTKLTHALQQSLQNDATQSLSLSKEEKDLIDLGRQCEDCAVRLQHEIEKSRARPHASRSEAMRTAARVVFRRGRFVKIQEQLDGYRKVLETSLLYRLSERFEVLNLRNSERFTSFNQALQNVIARLSNSQTCLEMLLKQGTEQKQTQQHIIAQLERSLELQKNDLFYQDVKKSLLFPGIFSRQAQVDNEFEGIVDSYGWIFAERSGSDDIFGSISEYHRKEPRWGNFSNWLRNESGVYWVNGKAGSGKSTLMNYIWDHEKTKKYLKEWSADRQLVTPTFFFWSAGSPLQKSIEGLLRSLVYQMLIECPEFITCFKDEPLHGWTEKRLLNKFGALLKMEKTSTAICLFIDGLDEFDGRYATVVETINSLTSQAHVKVCLSSRPLLEFEGAFSREPNLRLQDLTFDSIHAYATARLSEAVEQKAFYNMDDKKKVESLTKKIVELAEGVFLWAVFAIRCLRDGLEDMANLDELQGVIKSLPEGIENLYIRMVTLIKPACKRDAARFLQMSIFVSDGGISLDLFRLYFIDRQWTGQDLPLNCTITDQKVLVDACYVLKSRLRSHTMGLLDLSPKKKMEMIHDGSGDYDQIVYTEVNVFHKTVKDFFIHNSTAKSFLETAGSGEEYLRLSLARGTLSYLHHLSRMHDGPCQKTYRDWLPEYNTLSMAMDQISMVEQIVGVAQSKLMRSLNAYSFMPKRRIVIEREFDVSGLLLYKPYIIQGIYGTSVDLIGMAASRGMVRYVVEVLGTPFAQNSCPQKWLSDCQQSYFAPAAFVAMLSWASLSEYDIDYSCYRQKLSQHLRWEGRTGSVDRIDGQMDCNTIAETYLLNCCEVQAEHHNLALRLKFMEHLLHAGANPMVSVQPAGYVTATKGGATRHRCIWDRWLDFLYCFREYNIRKSGTRDHARSTPFCADPKVTLDDVFNTTKALLAQGANINYRFRYEEVGSLKRYDLRDYKLNFEITASAMFVLEECFKVYPEFREFAAAVALHKKRPWRHIVSIYLQGRCVDSDKPKAYPNKEDSEMLWPLIENWEATGNESDLSTLKLAMKRVWRAHRPDIELEEGPYESSDENSDENTVEEWDEKSDETDEE